jgi:hypothetical protein
MDKNNKNFVNVNVADLNKGFNPALDPAFSLRNIQPNVKNPNQKVDLKKEMDKLINFEKNEKK